MDLAAMFGIGLLGSGHCLGMCGGFALTIGATGVRFGPVLAHQLVYGLGRLFTYSFLGAAAGLIGGKLAKTSLPVVGAQQVMAVVAGVMMLYIGFNSLGILRFKWLNKPGGEGLFSSMLRQFINSRGLGPFLLAGVFTGFLPCGLVYAALAKTMTTADPFRGWLSMLVFGLGTIPAMTALGCGTTFLSKTMQTRIVKLAAVFVILLGAMTIYRGIPFEDSCCSAKSRSAAVSTPQATTEASPHA